ncbi:MAG: MFS transporter [SAR202 cluster bacterium]|nr:MFS transporter [SAR202 cluster bacterium]|tara:strand:+ start:3632 stop:4861 length:1230 start_codon:yes stop_codon:yes gene_type:complete
MKNFISVISIFKHKSYTIFWIGNAFSNLGIWALGAGRSWLMQELTNSPFMLGLLALSGSIPLLFFSVFGGVVADRVDRLKLVTFTRGCFAFFAFITGFLIFQDYINPLQLIIITLCTGTLMAFDIPSRAAIVPNLVPKSEVPNAILVYSFMFSGAGLIGPAYFAPVVKYFGIETLFLLVGISYVLTVIMFLVMPNIKQNFSSEKSSILSDLIDGIFYILNHRVIGWVMFSGLLVGIFGTSYSTLLPTFSDLTLGTGVYGYSYMLFSAGLGGLLGTVFLSFYSKVRLFGIIHTNSALLIGFGILALSYAPDINFSLVLIGFLGIVGMSFGVVNNTLTQSLVDEKFRGRVMSLYQLTWAGTSFGGLLIGSVAEHTTVRDAFAFNGIITIIFCGLISFYVYKKVKPILPSLE